jgi:transcriptional regulator with XRE-family HTH domain
LIYINRALALQVLKTFTAMKECTGSKIRKIRELKNISQNYVATRLGISQAAYSMIESGKTKVTDEKLLKISEALEVPRVIILNFDAELAMRACKVAPPPPQFSRMK